MAKKNPKTERIGLNVTPALYDSLSELAGVLGLSRSELVVRILTGTVPTLKFWQKDTA